MKLNIIQSQFQDYILHGQADFEKKIVSTEKVSAKTRLTIYSYAYRARLIDALASNYPVLNAYIGSDQFEQIAIEYIAAHPSPFRSIRWFGDQLPDFLSQHQTYQAWPFLSELALFEWTQTLVFDAADENVLGIEAMINIAPESWAGMTFYLHPSFHFIKLTWDVVSIWQAMMEEQDPQEVTLYPSPMTWILWRQDLMNQFCAVSEDEAWALQAIAQGNTFGKICEGLCQWIQEEEAPQHAATLLRKWIQFGLLSALHLP